MREDDLAFVDSLKEVLHTADTANYASRIHDAIARLARFARGYWNEIGNGSVWENSAPAWREVRECLSRVERLKRESEATQLWWSSGCSLAENCAFLASQATNKDHIPKSRDTAKKELVRLLASPYAQTDEAIELLVSLAVGYGKSESLADRAPACEVTEKVAGESFVMADVREPQLPTLTAYASEIWDKETLAENGINITSKKSRSEQLEETVNRLFDRFDLENDPRGKYEALCKLKSIGGCVIARGLSDRLAAGEPYLQCWILKALDELAWRPYRKQDSPDCEEPTRQIETVDAVLQALGDVGSRGGSACIREAVNIAKESVTSHRAQFLRSQD